MSNIYTSHASTVTRGRGRHPPPLLFIPYQLWTSCQYLFHFCRLSLWDSPRVFQSIWFRVSIPFVSQRSAIKDFTCHRYPPPRRVLLFHSQILTNTLHKILFYRLHLVLDPGGLPHRGDGHPIHAAGNDVIEY